MRGDHGFGAGRHGEDRKDQKRCPGHECGALRTVIDPARANGGPPAAYGHPETPLSWRPAPLFQLIDGKLPFVDGPERNHGAVRALVSAA
jgi:hypothetical protein